MTPAVEARLLKVLDQGFLDGLRLGFEGAQSDFNHSQAQLAKQLKL